MKNILERVEKELKSGLKHNKNFKFSKGLALTFLMTGSFINASENLDLTVTAKNLEKKIQKLRQENKKKLKYSRLELERLENEGDQVIKSPWESYIFSTLFGYKDMDSQSKDWKYGSRENTSQDMERALLRSFLGLSSVRQGTTGWITETNTSGEDGHAWTTNTDIYDNTATFTIIPTIKVPQVETPLTPQVELPSINAPFVPPAPNVTLAPVTVNPITVNVTAPGTVSSVPAVALNSPGNIDIGTILVDVNVNVNDVKTPIFTDVQPPVLNLTPPSLNVAPVTPPSIQGANPDVPQAPAVYAPQWDPYSAPGQNWLGRGSYYRNYLSVDKISMSLHNNFDSTPRRNYGTGAVGAATTQVHSERTSPLFNEVGAKGGKFVAINGSIAATGQTVTLTDKDGTVRSTAGNKVLSGWNGVAGKLLNKSGGNYTGYTDPITAADYMPGYSPDANELAANGKTFTIDNNRAVEQAHTTIFTTYGYHNPVFDGIEAHFGAGATLMNTTYTTGTISMKHSNLNMYGSAAITAGLLGQSAAKIDFTGTNVNVYGSKNTFFSLNSSTGANSHADINQSGQFSFVMDNNIDISKSETVILKVDNSHNDPGNDAAMSNPAEMGRKWFKQYVYLPYLGAIDYKNTGTVNMYGAKNAAIRINAAVLGNKNDATPAYNPVNNIESSIEFGGDQNVGIYFGRNNTLPASNGIFNGTLKLNFGFGNKLSSGAVQEQNSDGNLSGGDTKRAESSVGMIVDSGQRSELNVKMLYPATERYTEYRNFNSQQTPLLGTTYTGDGVGAFTVATTAGQAYIFDGAGNVRSEARIKSVNLNDFKVTFGKYSKDNIAVVSRNGSVVDWSSNVTDNAPMVSGTDESSTAIGSTLAYAEGIWFNPRQRGLQNSSYVWRGIAYGILSQQGGKYYVPEFRSTINITNNATVNSIKSVPFYAKDGGYITTKSLTLNGYGSTGAMAYAENHKAATLSSTEVIKDKEGNMIYDGNSDHTGTGNTNAGGIKWSSEDAYYGPTITDAAGNVISHSSVLPKTEIIVTGDITATKQGPKRDALGNIAPGTDMVNDNTAAAAVVKNGVNGAEIKISGKINVNGVGAFAKGTGALVDIQSGGSIINTGQNGALIALEKGKVNFGGGTIEHKDTYTDSHEGKLVFYADETAGSNINFKGATTMNVYDGVVFYGSKIDYSSGAKLAGESGRYTGMSQVTVNLKNHGVNLGVFVNPGTLTWDGTDDFLNNPVTGLRNFPKVAAINTGSYWYKTSLDGAVLNVTTNVNRDSISSGSTAGDGFNDLIMERVMVNIGASKTISSAAGNGLAIGSNSKAVNNTEAGYTVDGKISISGGTGANTGAYVSYGQINNKATGEIIVNKGVGVYGVNGSKLVNEGLIQISGKTSATEGGVGIVGLSRKINSLGVPTADTFGTDLGSTPTTQKVIEIENKGTIKIYDGGTTPSSNAIGIYADNNTGAARNRVTVLNNGEIVLGDKSVGVYIKGTTQGGELTLKTTAPASGADITVGKESFGVLVENSKVTLDGNYSIKVGENGVALNLKDDMSTLNTGPASELTVLYNHADPSSATTRKFGTGLYYEGAVGKTLTNDLNITVGNVSGITASENAILGIYAKGAQTTAANLTKLINTGKITLTENDYGIYGKTVDITNNGQIEVKKNGAGIYAEDANITTKDDLIKVTGENSVGLYLNGNNNTTYERVLTLNHGTANMNITGEEGIGVFAKDGARINILGQILLGDSNTVLPSGDMRRKTGIYLENTKRANEIGAAGLLTVGKDNIGVYLNNSNLKNSGKISVENGAAAQNIGVYAFAKDKSGVADSFTLENTGTIEVNGLKNIGIYGKTDSGVSGNQGTINLSSGKINVTASDPLTAANVPLGVYVKGENINVASTSSVTKISENGIGVYLEGNSTLGKAGGVFNGDFTLKSAANSKPAIGAYFKDGAQALSGNIKVVSTGTASDSSGNPIRPIGLFYAANTGTLNNGVNVTLANDGVTLNQETIGIYAAKVADMNNTGNIIINANAKGIGGYFKETNLVNTGNVTVNADGAFGLYMKADGITASVSSNAGIIAANNKDSVGIILDDKAELTNTGTISSNSGGTASQSGSIGVYVTNQGKFINDNTGNLTSTAALSGANPGSVGIYTKNGIVENKGNITSEYLGIYGEKDSSLSSSNTLITHEGSLNVNSGIGIYTKDTGTKTNLKSGGTITGTTASLAGVMAYDKAEVTLDGTNISLTGDYSNAVILGNSIGNTDKSSLTLKAGNITVGKEGTAIYSKNGNITIDSGYTGLITIGEKGTGVYADRNTTIGAGTLETVYSHGTNKGVGIFYDGGTQNNQVTVKQHAGNNNLINIYAQDIALVNNADQEVSQNGIGIFIKGPGVASTLENKKELSLTGSDSVGIVTETGSSVIAAGKITGVNGEHDKIGVYVKGGDISGTSAYDFDIDGGIGMYLNNAVSYTGTMDLKGGIYDNGTKYRTIGILAAPSFGTGTLAANIDMTGAGGIGVYQETGTNVTYNGKIDLLGTSTLIDQGIGVYTKNGSTFTLGSLGEVKVGGTNNIGFYVEAGGTLNISGGTVTNTEDGIFAYLEGGSMTFTSGSSNINYANVIVASGGSLVNQTTIATGKTGLQATGVSSLLVPSTILNDTGGVINSSTLSAVAMTGLDGAYIDNKGKISLTGDGAIGIYVRNAKGVSSGEVNINEKSVAYYANQAGGELTITGTSNIGKHSTLLAVENGGKINYQSGAINLGDERYGALIDGAASVIDFGGNDITVGEKSVAVMLQNGGQLNNTLHDINVGKAGVGIYLADATNIISPVSRTINLSENATGIYGDNGGNIQLDGNILSVSDGAKGIASKNSALSTIENAGNIDLSGKASVGMYGEGIDTIKNNAGKTIKVGESNTATGKAGVALFGLNSSALLNEGTLEFGKGAAGIYGENISSGIENRTGAMITNNGQTNGTGIFSKNSLVENRGDILLGDTSNGIYAENGQIDNYGNVTAGNEKSSGLFGAGAAAVNHNSGTVTVGANSVALASENGNIINNSILTSTGEGSTYIYSKNGNGETNAALTLTDKSVGMYGQSGVMTNNNIITVGKSDVAAKEFSVGMATESGKIVNTAGAQIIVGKEAGVGMFASGVEVKHPDGTTTYGPSGTAENYGTIDVTGLKAYGMLGTNGATVYNAATGIINVDGTGAKGIIGTNDANIINDGIVNVNGAGSQGIYIERGATLTNTGQINVNGDGKIGVFIGMGSSFVNTAGITISSGGTTVFDGGGTLANIGDIVIDGPTATVNGITINNTGKIEITGSLDFTGNILLETTPGKAGTINVGGLSGTGHIILSPDATLGNNYDMHHVQLLGGLSNPETETIRVTSQSVSFIAEKYFDKDLNSYVLTLTRIPYAQMLKNTEAVEFGKGLDELHSKGPGDTEMDMFDALKSVSDKDELAETFDMQLRGNVYANIQQRMMDVSGVLDTAYKQLKSEENTTKDITKVSAIYSGGNITDKNPGVEEYDYQSLGIMYLKEKETLKYGTNFNYSLGILQSKFDFDQGSKEDITSLKAGIGYEQYLKQGSRFKYMTRGELGVNYHDMERKIYLSNGTYKNNGDYFSGTAEWKNRLNYELPIISKNFKMDIFGSLNTGYGKFQGFKEDGDGMYLDVKSEDYFSLRPGAGVEGEWSYTTVKGSKFMLTAGAAYEYETQDIYGDGNEVKIANTDAGYYRLEEPEKIDNIFKANVGVGYETSGGFKTGVRVEREEGSVKGTKYQLDFSWKF